MVWGKHCLTGTRSPHARADLELAQTCSRGRRAARPWGAGALFRSLRRAEMAPGTHVRPPLPAENLQPPRALWRKWPHPDEQTVAHRGACLLQPGFGELPQGSPTAAVTVLPCRSLACSQPLAKLQMHTGHGQAGKGPRSPGAPPGGVLSRAPRDGGGWGWSPLPQPGLWRVSAPGAWPSCWRSAEPSERA